MPIDHYRMTIQAKPLSTLGGKPDSETDQVLLGISRPLGHLRKTKSVSNTLVDIPKPEPSDEEFPQIHGIGYYDSEDEMSSKGSAVSKDTSRSKHSRRGSLPSVGMSKTQLFESRYKLAAARSQPDATKPANMYSKRVVYLPMFRINVETYIGESEDHKTVETTRQSLKKMLDNSRSKMKSPDKIANKLRDYFKQQELESIRKREREQENEISRKEMLRVNIPKTPFPVDSNAIRIPSVPLDGRIHGPSSKVETLDLTSITDDDSCSVLSANTNKTKQSGNGSPKFHSERGSPNGFSKKYFGPFIYGKESQTERESNYATYSDIRRMRQKGRLKIVTKTDGSAKTSRSASDQQDAKDWITIQSKPVLKYTTPQPTKPKLDPIVVPSQGCSECPLCKAAKYKSTEPTTVPPNSPTIKRAAFSEEGTPEIQDVHRDHLEHNINNATTTTSTSTTTTHFIPTHENFSRKLASSRDPETREKNFISHKVASSRDPETHESFNRKLASSRGPETYESFTRKLASSRGPEVQVKKAVIHNDILPVSKVTVKISRSNIGHLKDAKLTKSNSSSIESINEL